MADKRIRVSKDCESYLEDIMSFGDFNTESKAVSYIIKNYERLRTQLADIMVELSEERAAHKNLKAMIKQQMEQKQAYERITEEIVKQIT